MKKIITFISVLLFATSLATAEMYIEQETTQNFRAEFDLSVFADSNLMINTAGVDVSAKFSTFDNHVGLILGVREMNDFMGANDSILWYPIIMPIVGIDLWNVNIVGGYMPDLVNGDSYNFLIHLAYNFNVITPDPYELGSGLSIRVGASWYPTHSNLIKKEGELADLGAILWSVIIPRLEVGVTYRLGKSFAF